MPVSAVAHSSSFPDQLPLFNALPGANLLLTPDLRIVGASNDYLAASLMPREALIGQFLFDAFPENPEAPEANAEANVRASLAQVLATGQPHEMAPQHYDIPDPAHPGRFLERHWLPRHTPVLDAAGQVQYLIQSAQDITASRLAEQQGRDRQHLQALNEELEAQVQARTQEALALQAQALATVQRQARERATLYQVFEETPALICILRGPEHRYEYFNAAYQRQFAGRELPGCPVAEALPEAVAQGFLALLDNVYQTGETYFGQELQLTMDAPGGAPARPDYYNLTYQAYREDGRIVGVCVFAYVVTAQVEARHHNDALQAQVLAAAQQQADQRALLYQIFEQTPAVVALLRAPHHRFEYVNPAYQALFPGRQLVGRDVNDAVPEMAAQGYVALMDRAYQTGETHFGHEQPFAAAPTPGQAPRTGYFNFTYQAYRESGEIVGIAIFAYDVTEQVLARQQREAQQQQLRELFEQAPVAIGLFAGPDYVVEVCNPGLQAIWRRTAEQALNRPLFEVLPEVRDQGFKELLDEVRRTGTPHVAAEMPAELLRNGQPEPAVLNFVYQPIRDAQGGIRAVAAVAVDVSEQVAARQLLAQANSELTAANQQLTRTNADLDNFIYTASHDLKVPIANIEGLLQAFARKLPPAALVSPVPEMLQRMQQSTERFRRTIEQLTEVSKLQQAHDQPATQVLLSAVVEEVRLDLVPLIEQTRAHLTVAVPADARLPFSEKNLRSVVYNLLSNALKYRHPDRTPEVQLTYFQQDKFYVLRVQDNGLGFEVATSEAKLYGLFQRLHTHVEGSGIGLYMVKKMVENGGGRINVASQPGEGTTFTVFIPITPAS